MYIEHPLIVERTLEARAYQVNIAGVCAERSTLVVLPTGMGKTVIALLLIADRVARGRVLFTAPTKPLVEQHHRFLRDHLRVDGIEIFTGETPPARRADLWRDARVVVATPQVVENDLMNGRITLDDVSLIVFDEAHRAVGNYAYVYIAGRYREDARDPLVMGMTASPGSQMDKILTVCQNLGIVWIEARTEADPDVLPYVHRIRIQWIRVPVPDTLKRISALLRTIYDEQVKKLRTWGLLPKGGRPNIRQLLAVQDTIRRRMAGGKDRSMYQAATVQAIALKVNHAMELAETQGMDALRTYMRKLEEEAASRGGSKASRKIVSHPAFIEARELLPQEVDHPKMEALERIVHNQLADNPDSRIIVFTHYRETAELVTERLNADPIIGAVRFVGQTCRGEDRGLSQKRQVEIIEAFKRGEYNVLVATSVAEEGLDIPSTDLVVFFEPVSSEIRTIQRRGRTGRRRVGRVVILISGGTRDEAYYWSSTRKERNMKAELDRIRRMLREGVMAEGGGAETGTATGPPEGADGRPDDDGTTIPDDPITTRPASPLDDLMARGARDAGAVARAESSEEVQKSQATLDRYAVDIRIIADMREFRSPVVKEISRHGILVEGRQLEVGDYILSSRLAVERKTAEDLAASIVDGRLFQQMKALASAYPTPVIIVEGAVFSTRVPETALMGALGALVVDFRIPVINTSSPDETAALLVAMAKREAKGRRTPAVRAGRVSRDPEDRKQYVIEGLPNVSGVLARRLLEHFGSVRAVMNATEEELMQVKGLGRMKAAGIVRILEEEWRG